ncbi:MAG: hypothetical protein P0S96_05920 [Simkaniaceae bacterium]|nr:hypothetical protein [Candidatus Sacchlamyda saccharinae]
MAAIPPPGGGPPYGLAQGPDVQAEAVEAKNAGRVDYANALQDAANLPPPSPLSTPAELQAHLAAMRAQIAALQAEQNGQ